MLPDNPSLSETHTAHLQITCMMQNKCLRDFVTEYLTPSRASHLFNQLQNTSKEIIKIRVFNNRILIAEHPQ